MSLISRITEVIQQIAIDIKALNSNTNLNRQIKFLTAEFNTTLNSLTEITQFKTPLTIGIYRVSLSGNFRTVATTTGGKIYFRFSGTSNSAGYIECNLTHLAAATNLRSTIDNIDIATYDTRNGIVTTGVGAISTPVNYNSELYVQVLTEGNLSVYFGSEIAGSAITFELPTVLIIEKIN